MPTCPYHGIDEPCKDCWTRRMGVFSSPRFAPRDGECPYHGGPRPCFECYKKSMGEFAHEPAPSPPYRPPVHPEHIHQTKPDTCGIACCGMAGLFFHGQFTMEDLQAHMEKRGIYIPGDQSLFHALDGALTWLGLSSKLCQQVRPADLAPDLQNNCILILEGGGHVIVIFAINRDGTFIIGDPAMYSVEMRVDPNDYRLKGTGRIWKIWKQ